MGSGSDPQGVRRRRTGGGCPQRRRLRGRTSVGSINVGATEGRRAAPGKCRLFAAELCGHRRRRPARPARSQGRRVCGSQGRGAGARRGTRRERRGDRDEGRRRRLRHRVYQALDLLLGSCPGTRTVAWLPAEYSPYLAIMAANGFDVRALSVDSDGRLVVDEAATALSAEPPALVHLTALARRGPACRGHRRGVPRPWRAVGDRRRSRSATSTVCWAPMRSTRPRANGWPARAAAVFSRSGPRWRSGCDRGCRRTGICR